MVSRGLCYWKATRIQHEMLKPTVFRKCWTRVEQSKGELLCPRGSTYTASNQETWRSLPGDKDDNIMDLATEQEGAEIRNKCYMLLTTVSLSLSSSIRWNMVVEQWLSFHSWKIHGWCNSLHGYYIVASCCTVLSNNFVG
jgi:hypothetical protein